MKPIGLNIKNNIAYLGNHNLCELVKEFKTPLYVMDEAQLNKNISDYLKYFKSTFIKTTVVYASKAFLTYEFCKYLKEYDISMDAVSLGDMYIAKEAGFPMERIVLHGNNKSIEELNFAVCNKIGLIVVDNLYELNELIKITKDKEQVVNVLFRINPNIDAHTHKYIQTSNMESKFGVNIEDNKTICKMIDLVKNDKSINLKGIHAHIGSQIFEKEAFILESKKLIEFVNQINQDYDLNLNVLNLGGGFGIKYLESDLAIPTSEMMKELVKFIESQIQKTNSLVNHIMIEPGRSIVGNAGITLYSCSQIKQTYGKKQYLFIDGGMADNIRPALYDAVYSVDVVNKINNKKEVLVDIVGKCCESGDIIRKDVLVPQIESGDVLMVYSTGAYNYTMSSNYNSLLRPAVVLVGEDIKVLKQRQKLSDLI
jgi:diaminopimelate decarboxylase